MAVPNAAPETQAHAGDRQGAGRACQHSDEEGCGAYPHSSERGIRAGEEPGRDTRARAWHIHTHAGSSRYAAPAVGHEGHRILQSGDRENRVGGPGSAPPQIYPCEDSETHTQAQSHSYTQGLAREGRKSHACTQSYAGVVTLEITAGRGAFTASWRKVAGSRRDLS
jgi:hypothetical protein